MNYCSCRLVMCPSFTVMERTPLIKVTLHYLYIASTFILPWNFAHVFAKKQCILCSALCHKRYLTLPYVTSLRDSFCLGTFAHGFIMLSPSSLAALQPRVFESLIVGNEVFLDLLTVVFKLILVSRASFS